MAYAKMDLSLQSNVSPTSMAYYLYSTYLGFGWWIGSACLIGSSLVAMAQVSSLPLVETEPEKGCLS